MIIYFLLILQVSIFIVGWRIALNKAPNGINARLPLAFRIILSLSLLLAAFLVYENSPSVYSSWVFLGMVASFLGDLAMAEIIPFNNRIVGGMLLFGIAHILYIISYTKTARFLGGMLIDMSFIIPAFLYGIIAVYAWFFHIRSSKISHSINAASLAYSLWLGFMASTALQLAIKFGSRWWAAAAGAFLFVLSDFTIGVSMIGRTKFKSPEIFIWFTYLAGQAGIIYSPWIVYQFF